MQPAVLGFLFAASAAAALHALIPDHWLPFVLLGRARDWTVRKTLSLALAGGLIHVIFAVGLGFLAWWLGAGCAEAVAVRLGQTMEILSALALTAFGLVYGGYSWYRERRHHPPTGSEDEGKGIESAHHHHGHILENWFSGDLSGLSLVVVIGVSPCAVAFPILIASAASLGFRGVLLVAGAFGLTTLATTLAVTLFGLYGSRRVDVPFLSRYGDLVSGLLIAVVGAAILVLEFHAH